MKQAIGQKQKRQMEMEQRALAAKEALAAEQAIVRAMTYEELVTATVELISEETGLGVIIERHWNDSAEIHLTTPVGNMRLGHTSVTQYNNGKYGVGGVNGGCMMSNGSEFDIANVLQDKFRDLEDRANAPKKTV